MEKADKEKLHENQKKAVERLVYGLNAVQRFSSNFDYSELGQLVSHVKALASSCGLWIGTKMDGYDRVFVVEEYNEDEERPF